MFYHNKDLPDSLCHACMAGCQAEMLGSPTGDTACGRNKTYCVVLVCHSTRSYLLLLLCGYGHVSIMRPVSGGMCTHRSSLTLGSSLSVTIDPPCTPNPSHCHTRNMCLIFYFSPMPLFNLEIMWTIQINWQLDVSGWDQNQPGQLNFSLKKLPLSHGDFSDGQ